MRDIGITPRSGTSLVSIKASVGLSHNQTLVFANLATPLSSISLARMPVGAEPRFGMNPGVAPTPTVRVATRLLAAQLA